MKRCACCGIEKSEAEFQRRKASKDGLTAACKVCLQKRDAERYDKERVLRLQRMREYASGRGKEAVAEAKARWRARNAEKRAAHVILGNAVRDGRVVKPSACWRCGSSPVEAHHFSYDQPLLVSWLCRSCHIESHKITEGLARQTP